MEKGADRLPLLRVLDFDGTMVKGDAFLAFLLFVFARHPRLWWRSLRLATEVLFFTLGKRNNAQLKTLFIREVVAPLPSRRLEEVLRTFVSQFRSSRLRPEVPERIRRWKEGGDRVILLSASPDFLVRPLVDGLGLDAVLATLVEVREDGRPTGVLPEGNFRSERKVEVLREYCAVHGPFAEVQAFTDHHSDIPLLGYADRGVLVHPTRQLAVWAAGRERVSREDW